MKPSGYLLEPTFPLTKPTRITDAYIVQRGHLSLLLVFSRRIKTGRKEGEEEKDDRKKELKKDTRAI